MTGNVNKQGSLENSLGIEFGIEKGILIIAIAAIFLVMCFASLFSGGEASIATFSENPIPTAFKVVMTTDGAIAIFAPANTPGHWETNGDFFSDQSLVLFCPIEKFGLKKYTFVPDNPTRCKSSVYAVVCRFTG